VVRPELVLVDPELAARLRARPRTPPSQREQGHASVLTPVPAASAPSANSSTEYVPYVELARKAEAAVDEEPSLQSRSWRSTRVLAIASVMAAAAASATFVLMREPPAEVAAPPPEPVVRTTTARSVPPEQKRGNEGAAPRVPTRPRAEQPRRRPPQTATPKPSRAPREAVASQPQPSRQRPTANASPPRTDKTQQRTAALPSSAKKAVSIPPLAWPPVRDASAYRVELHRGGRRVFLGVTTRPRIAVPSTWQLAGRTEVLTPGRYRWYVWARVSGRWSTQPIIASDLPVE
jgi:hypothetical protein